MKHLRSLWIGIVIVLSAATLGAQDIHFTQFYLSPLTLNPAYTGKFSGTARIHGIYRQQGLGANTIGGNALYVTPGVNIDAPILLGFSDKHWIGVGAAFYSDKAGSLNLGLTGFQGSLGYHIGLGGSSKSSAGRRGRGRKGGVSRAANKVRGAVGRLKDKSRTFVPSKTYLSIGLTYGSRSRQFDLSEVGPNAIFNQEREMVGSSPDRDALMREGNSARETAAGVMLTSEVNDKLDIQFGVSAFRIIPDRFSVLSQGQNGVEDQNIKMTYHANADYQIDAKWSLHPQFMLRTQGDAMDANLQALGGYLLQPEKQISLMGGLGYRLDDALLILLGAQVGDLRVGMAFDYTTSDLTDSGSTMNGFELGASYIIRIYKKPDADPVIFCPRL